MASVVQNEFDYIIAGGGMAGMSLAYRLNRSLLNDKRILIIDRDLKITNDRTWCFWEKEPTIFEDVIYRRWNNLWFHGTNSFSKKLEIAPYEYKMIRAVDFYSYVKSAVAPNPRISFLTAEIDGLDGACVSTSAGDFCANEIVFDSFTRKGYNNPEFHNLYQHFLGWTVRCRESVFDPDAATLFDFRVAQNGDCRFFYILPFSSTEALVEYTVFSGGILDRSEYQTALEGYLDKECGAYEKIETEFGVIPMSDEPHKERISEKVIRIGTSGGYVKPSTGYSFRRTQLWLDKLVKRLEASRVSRTLPRRMPVPSKWKRYLDSVFLEVLEKGRHPAADVFTRLFLKNSASNVLRFLDEETSFAEDLAIMRTVPLRPFAVAAFGEAIK